MAGGLFDGPTGVWDTVLNWTTGVPVTGDLASVPASQVNDVIGPTGANQNVDLDIFETHPEYRGDVGSSGSPIILASSLVHAKGSGSFFFKTSKNGGSNFVTDEVRIETSSPSTRVEIGSDAGDVNSNIERVNIHRGHGILVGDIRFSATSVVVLSSLVGDEATCKIVQSADTLPDYKQIRGRGEIDNLVTRLAILGGTCIKDVNAANIIDVYPGGNLVYNHAAIATDVTVCRVHTGATLDLNQNGRIKVFDLTYRYRGATIHYTPAIHTLNIIDLDRES